MSWEKVEIASFLKERKGRFKPDDEEIKNLERIDKINFSGQIYLSDKPSKTNMILIKNGDLVISGINVAKGAMAIYSGKKDVKATIHYSSYIYNKKKIDIKFLNHFLKSQTFINAIKEQIPGGIKTEIKPKHILPLKVFIPTEIDEQRKIVEILNNRNSVVNGISTALTHQLTLVKQLRKSFLREAMQGKLTSEWRASHLELVEGSHSATQLLAKIKAEKEQLIKEKKIKKQKPLPPISEEEIPFEIPENWVWCRLGEVCEKIGSGSTPKGSNYSDNGFPFFRSQNVHNSGLVYNDIKYISDAVQNKMNGTAVYSKDILLNITGGSLGRCALVPDDFEQGNVSQHVSIIRPISLQNSFIHQLVLSPLFQEYIFNSTTGAGREGLPKYNLEQFIIPIPSLSEQKRIVAKLDELMAYCDSLEESIKKSQAQNEMLLGQVLREALEPKTE